VRIRSDDARKSDVLELGLVQLKGGCAGFKPTERMRLADACAKLRPVPMLAMYDQGYLEGDVLSPSGEVVKRKKAS
jgi:hypothetical protein